MEHMEQMNLILKIQSAFNQFTKAEEGGRVLPGESGKGAVSLDNRSGGGCGVGEASVFRFCRTLGLSGYRNLKCRCP